MSVAVHVDMEKLPTAMRLLASLLTHGNIASLANVAVASATAFPRLHSVWSHVFQWFADQGALTPAGGDEVATAAAGAGGAAGAIAGAAAEAARALFLEMWKVIVDDQLMDSTHEKRATGLLVFAAVVVR
jgi:hypothetical protein